MVSPHLNSSKPFSARGRFAKSRQWWYCWNSKNLRLQPTTLPAIPVRDEVGYWWAVQATKKRRKRRKRKAKKRDSPYPPRVDGIEAVVRMIFFLRLSLIGGVRVLSTYGRRWRLFWGTLRYRHSPLLSFWPSPWSRWKGIENRIDKHISWRIASYNNNTEDGFRKRKEIELFR